MGSAPGQWVGGEDGVPHIMIHCAHRHAEDSPGPEPGVAYTPSQFAQACSRGQRARKQNVLRNAHGAQEHGPPYYIATTTGALRDSPVAALETGSHGVWARNLATANGRAQPPASMRVRDPSRHEEDGRAAR